MYDTKFYSLIDMDSSGRIRTALIPTKDEVQAISRGRPYLEEIVPHSFWLHTLMPLADSETILCPTCGSELKRVASDKSPHVRNSIYHCYRCSPT